MAGWFYVAPWAAAWVAVLVLWLFFGAAWWVIVATCAASAGTAVGLFIAGLSTVGPRW
jgi:hypothetical protein